METDLLVYFQLHRQLRPEAGRHSTHFGRRKKNLEGWYSYDSKVWARLEMSAAILNQWRTPPPFRGNLGLVGGGGGCYFRLTD